MTAHGKTSSYNLGCRCPKCREAHRVACAAAKERMVARAAAGEAAFEHGVYGYKNWNCRCPVCTKAHSADWLRRYHAARDREAS